MNSFIDQTLNGLIIGNIYALLAVGLALIFGSARLINFAHGSVYMVGAYIGWFCLRLGLPFPLMLLVVVLGCALVGLLLERFAVRPLQGKAAIAPLLATIGVSFILDQGAQVVFGPDTQAFPPTLPTWRIPVGGITIGALDLLIAGIGLGSGALLYGFLRFSRLGWAVRATAQDRDAALQMGVDVHRVNQTVFAIASALGGVSGVLVGMYYNSVYPTMGYQAGLKGIVAGLIGGLGSVPGAILGSLALGLIESYGVGLLGASYRNLFAFAILLLVLVLRPNGLFRRSGGLPPEPMTGTFMAASRPVRVPPWAVAVAVAVAAALPLVITSPSVLQIMINAWFFGLLALSLTLVAGTVGQVSLGHAGLLAIGGYASSLLSLRAGFPMALALLSAGLITAVLGMALIYPSFRLRGPYVVIATLGIGEIVRLVILNWDWLTGGPMGVTNIPPFELFGHALVTNREIYWFGLALLVLVGLLQWRLLGSHLGRTLRAIREDEVAAQAYGISLNRYKALAFAVSGFVAGLSGACMAHSYSYINSDTFTAPSSTLALTMVILGGMGNVLGAVLGAVILIALPEAFRDVTQYRYLIYGVVLLLLIRFRPQGLLGAV
ncbi:ABC transporter permease [Chloroflexia bacterium SDU3-3]|nr:ABC transporter permease [Chloroflexia bacterium SDU3-3]